MNDRPTVNTKVRTQVLGNAGIDRQCTGSRIESRLRPKRNGWRMRAVADWQPAEYRHTQGGEVVAKDIDHRPFTRFGLG